MPALGDSLLRYLRPSRLLELTHRYELPELATDASAASACEAQPSEEYAAKSASLGGSENLTVAVAFDAAFFGYFPDTLDAFERHGVTVRDFSPLRDEALPANTDIVYIGCGRPDLYLDELGENHCLLSALRDHVCCGRRIYAEGGGLAYLCRQIALSDGRHSPMAGVLPAVARWNDLATDPRPVERTIARDSWLGRKGRRVRGYLNEHWAIEPGDRHLTAGFAGPEGMFDLVERHQAIGSRVHLHLAAQPDLLESFLRPSHPALNWAVAR